MVGFLVSNPSDLIAALSSPLHKAHHLCTFCHKTGSGARVYGSRTIGVKEVKGFFDLIDLILRGSALHMSAKLRHAGVLTVVHANPTSSVKPGLSYVSFFRGAPLSRMMEDVTLQTSDKLSAVVCTVPS